MDKDYARALRAMDALRGATWFADYLQRMFGEVRAEERDRCALIAKKIMDKAAADSARLDLARPELDAAACWGACAGQILKEIEK